MALSRAACAPPSEQRGDVEAAAVEPVHRDTETGAFALRAAEHRVGGHPHTLQDDLRGRLGVPAHLELVCAETRVLACPFRPTKRRNAAWALGAGAGHHHVDVGHSGAGDELLDPVEDVVARRRGPPWCAARPHPEPAPGSVRQ